MCAYGNYLVVSFDLPRRSVTAFKHRAFVRLSVTDDIQLLITQLSDLISEFQNVQIVGTSL